MSSRRNLRERGEEAVRIDRLELDRNISELIQLLDSEFPDVRFGAIQALGRLGDSRAVPALMQCIDDPDRVNRSLTYDALGVLRAPEAEGVLVDGLHDVDEWVRESAASALSRVGDAVGDDETLAQRRAALREVVENDLELEVRLAAAESLAILGDTGVWSQIPEMIRALPWLRRRHPKVKRLKGAAKQRQPLEPYPHLWERRRRSTA